jgi:hypothetical protein
MSVSGIYFERNSLSRVHTTKYKAQRCRFLFPRPNDTVYMLAEHSQTIL